MGTQANIQNLSLGTGHTLFKSTILPAIEAAQTSVILITCFWAESETLHDLNESLLKLSNSARQRNTTVKVRIGFSSSSLLQKLFHTSDPAGHVYDPSEWSKTLGLPAAEDLKDLDLEVKSIFFLPFSVWHPKFVIIDNTRVFLPSCNVSWEDWFEGCVDLTGPIVGDFTAFWREHWASDGERQGGEATQPAAGEISVIETASSTIRLQDVPCKFLPSPHSRNPNFTLPWQDCPSPPKTPLNVELLELFASARKDVYMQTPNLTSQPVLDALVDALTRGVNVNIVTSERLMVLEQLVTAGTTTSRCVRHLVAKHQGFLRKGRDEEAGIALAGRLRVSYFEPITASGGGFAGGAEPVQSHLKLTLVDHHAAVFGSGNMDRASWYTSQELGVAFFSNELCEKVQQNLQRALKGRTRCVYDSDGLSG